MSAALKSTSSIEHLRIEIASARERGNRPRVHGNGFIQLDLSPSRRAHVWGDPRIPRQTTPSPIHNHTFSFLSTIYRGQIVHRELVTIPFKRGAYQMYQAVTRRGEDTRLQSIEGRYNVLISGEYLFRAGDKYNFEKHRFHETLAPWLCVTVIDKTEQPGGTPIVLVPFGHEPDNTFDRYQTDADLLWTVIREALA